MGRVHHSEIECPVRQSDHKVLCLTILNPKRDVRSILFHPRHPFDQYAITQAELAPQPIGRFDKSPAPRYGGSGYFPERVTRYYIESGALHRTENSPNFSLPAYVVSSGGFDKELLKLSISGLKTIANSG